MKTFSLALLAASVAASATMLRQSDDNQNLAEAQVRLSTTALSHKTDAEKAAKKKAKEEKIAARKAKKSAKEIARKEKKAAHKAKKAARKLANKAKQAARKAKKAAKQMDKKAKRDAAKAAKASKKKSTLAQTKNKNGSAKAEVSSANKAHAQITQIKQELRKAKKSMAMAEKFMNKALKGTNDHVKRDHKSRNNSLAQSKAWGFNFSSMAKGLKNTIKSTMGKGAAKALNFAKKHAHVALEKALTLAKDNLAPQAVKGMDFLLKNMSEDANDAIKMAKKTVDGMAHKLLQGHPELLRLYEMVEVVAKHAQKCMEEASQPKNISQCFNNEKCKSRMLKKSGKCLMKKMKSVAMNMHCKGESQAKCSKQIEGEIKAKIEKVEHALSDIKRSMKPGEVMSFIMRAVRKGIMSGAPKGQDGGRNVIHTGLDLVSGVVNAVKKEAAAGGKITGKDLLVIKEVSNLVLRKDKAAKTKPAVKKSVNKKKTMSAKKIQKKVQTKKLAASKVNAQASGKQPVIRKVKTAAKKKAKAIKAVKKSKRTQKKGTKGRASKKKTTLAEADTPKVDDATEGGVNDSE